MRRLAAALMGAGATLALSLSAALADVTVLGWPGGPEETALRAVTEIYNAQAADADKVKLIFFNRDGFWDKLQADLAAGSTEFDINLLATYAIGKYAPYMDPVTLPDGANALFGEKVLKTMEFDGKQYGVPTDLSLHFMYTRKDLMEKLLSDDAWKAKYAQIAKEKLGKDLQPKDPDQWTWDDWAATALFFTKSINDESPTRYGAVLQMKNLLFNIMVWQSTARSNGGDWMDAQGNITVDSEGYRKGLELYKMLYDAGASPKDSLSYEYAEANAAFGAGQAATMLQWNAAFADLDSAEKTPATAGKISTVAPPAGTTGRGTHIHGLGFGINKNSENKEGAAKFLSWLAGEDAMIAYAKAGGSPALAESVAAKVEGRPDLVKLGAFAGAYGFVMTGGTSANALPVYEAQAKAFTGYWGGTQDLDAALKEATTAMEGLLKQ